MVITGDDTALPISGHDVHFFWQFLYLVSRPRNYVFSDVRTHVVFLGLSTGSRQADVLERIDRLNTRSKSFG
jgi:hypothetical protein